VAIQGKKIIQHRGNVAPGSSHGTWQEEIAPLKIPFKDSGQDFPARASAAAGATAFVVLVVTFQRLRNQCDQATGKLLSISRAIFSGACRGRYRAVTHQWRTFGERIT